MSPPCPEVFPCPVFEGSEKHISISFSSTGPHAPPTTPLAPLSTAAGLRALSRGQLDAILDLAACQIISARSNNHFDAYVLSESSLFVYPDRMVLKTCGTTKLLTCIPLMVELAAGLGLEATRVKYTRASFLFPEQQPAPHHGFEHECATLQDLFSSLGSTSAYVLGDALNGMQWHVFVAGNHTATHQAAAASPSPTKKNLLLPETKEMAPLYTIEVCMTGLSPAKAAQFFKNTNQENIPSSESITVSSGIASLFSEHIIDDYLFEPCGYSMNGQCNAEFSTIHITPEEGFSYASVELCGYSPDQIAASDLVARAIALFDPETVAVALSADTIVPGADSPGWGSSFGAPLGYECHSASYQEVKCGGYVAYFTLGQSQEHHLVVNKKKKMMMKMKKAKANSLPFCLVDGADADRRKEEEPLVKGGKAYRDNTTSSSSSSSSSSSCDSPRGVLKYFPSFNSKASHGSSSSAVSSDLESITSHSDNASDNASDIVVNTGVNDPATATTGTVITFDDVVAASAAVPLLRADVTAIDAHIRTLIDQHALEDNFYVVDLGAVRRLYAAWGQALPRVHPHYAVKCNNDPALVAALASLGAGFDCASEAEVEQVIDLGVSPDRIIFANPCKRPSDIRSAAAKGITHSTFDTEAELLKLRRWAPGSRVLLRIRADDPTARCPLGNKFGAEEWEWEDLFAAAQRHDVPVDGISFHVGSGATNPVAFSYAIELARRAFDLGASYGFTSMQILDIGGGFSGGRFGADGRIDLGGVPAAVNAALAEHFPEGSGVRIIAEPGRYFAESIATLATLVYGRRARLQSAPNLLAMAGDVGNAEKPGEGGAIMDYDYWITDGLYGSMNCLLYDHATVAPRPLLCCTSHRHRGTTTAAAALKTTTNASTMSAPLSSSSSPCLSSLPHRPSTVFGPTCDGLDTVVRDYPLPQLDVGDWLLFPRMGAYTICGASKFNGVNAVDVPTFYIVSSQP